MREIVLLTTKKPGDEKLVLDVVRALGPIERQLIVERTKAGLSGAALCDVDRTSIWQTLQKAYFFFADYHIVKNFKFSGQLPFAEEFQHF